MKLEGARDIAAPQSVVWAALNDVDVLKSAVPGCESMTQTSPTSFEAEVVQRIGPVSARFRGVVTLSDIVEGVSYRINGEGKGGPAGFAKGGAEVQLQEGAPGQTRLVYVAEANVGGKIAQLGGRLIDGVAKKLADEFFQRFQAAVEAPQASEPAAPEMAAADAVERQLADGDAKPRRKSWFGRLVG